MKLNESWFKDEKPAYQALVLSHHRWGPICDNGDHFLHIQAILLKKLNQYVKDYFSCCMPGQRKQTKQLLSIHLTIKISHEHRQLFHVCFVTRGVNCE